MASRQALLKVLEEEHEALNPKGDPWGALIFAAGLALLVFGAYAFYNYFPKPPPPPASEEELVTRLMDAGGNDLCLQAQSATSSMAFIATGNTASLSWEKCEKVNKAKAPK